MCIITYLPLDENSYLLGVSREESTSRNKVNFPVSRVFNERLIVYPEDAASQGSWMAGTNESLSICLMNGAFVPYTRFQNPAKSRGLVLLEAAECINPVEFMLNYDLQNIEPFTILFIENQSPAHITEFRWDGKSKFVYDYNPVKSYIWSSVMLHDPDEQKELKHKFSEWLENKVSFDRHGLMEFHKENMIEHQPDKDPEVQTQSITIMEKNGMACDLEFWEPGSDQSHLIHF